MTFRTSSEPSGEPPRYARVDAAPDVIWAPSRHTKARVPNRRYALLMARLARAIE